MVYLKNIQTSFAVALALSLSTNAAPHSVAERATSDLSLTAQLKLADSTIERYQLLPNNEDFVFDFNKSAVPVANHKNFPVLVGTGVSFSVAELPACSMNFVHLHPRATELFAVTSGRLHSEMVPEGGVVDSDGKPRVIKNDLSAGQITVYPAGSFHTQVNPDCEPAGFAAAFNAEDYGLSVIANQTLAFSDDIAAATFGKTVSGEDVDTVRDMLPGGALIVIEDCLKKCNIKKRAL